MVWWHVVLVILVSYLCGNISFSRLIAKSKNQDITKLGSGNPGSTNVLRNYGAKMGIINLALDMLKSFVPSLLAFYLFNNSYLMLYVAGFSSILGHMFPVVYGFKGGKGVATTIGMFLASNPIALTVMFVIGFIVWAIFEYGAIVSFLVMSTLTVIEGIRFNVKLPDTDRKIICLILFAIFVLTWYAHRKNIERLLLGQENKASIFKKAKKKLKNNSGGKE